MPLEVQNNPFPSILMVEAADETDPTPDALPSPGSQRLIVGPDHLLYLLDDAGVATVVGGGGGIANPLATDSLWDAAGDLVQGTGANTSAKLSAGTAGKVLTSNGASAALTWETPSSGGITIVSGAISGDFTTASDSAWHDITGLTGYSLTAGTWMAFIDIEYVHSGNLGPVWRVTDGTNTYAQAAYISGAPPAAVSTHRHFDSRPFVLSGSATLKVQVFSDTVFTIKQYPTRGSDTSIAATSAVFLKVA